MLPRADTSSTDAMLLRKHEEQVRNASLGQVALLFPRREIIPAFTLLSSTSNDQRLISDRSLDEGQLEIVIDEYF